MCFDGDDGRAQQQALAQQQAAELRAREDKRRADITAGQGAIDSAFAQFGPEYYDQFKQTYRDAYVPQIGDQYATARDKLVAALAGRGTLESTVGANEQAKLLRTRANAEAEVGGAAQDAANQLRGNVEQAKTNLYGLNTSVADPAAIATQAHGAASAVAAPQAFPTLGDIFSGALSAFSTASKADASSMNPQMPWNRVAPPTYGRGTSVMGR